MKGSTAEQRRGCVSIVMASYNSASYIGATIESILAQSYEDWELIIVDDNSSDESVSVIVRYAEQDSRIRYIVNEVNQGPGVTRNKGIEAATGRFLSFIDSDDLWDPFYLETATRFIDATGCPLVYASYNRVDEELNPIKAPFIVPEAVSYDGLLRTCSISCLTAMIDVKKIGKYYMPDIRKRQDYVLWLKILKDIGEARGIVDVLATYRMRKGSVSRNKIKAMYYIWRVYRDHEDMSLLKSIYYIIIYAYNGVVKYRV